MTSVNTSVWNIIGSMKSVDKWSQAAQSNITNSNVPGYKQYDINIGGGFATQIMSNPSMMRAGIQIAEQFMAIAYTSIDWRQGDVIPTQSDTDFAVNGEGFFMLTEGPPAPGSKLYYTRNGQFHTDVNGKLVNNNGLFYVTRADAVTMGLMSGGTGQHALALVPTLGNLQYSKFGSTIFELGPQPGNIIVDEPEKSGLGIVRSRNLEASNVNTEKQIVSLNESKNAYTVLAKQLTVYWANFDIGMNLLR